MRRRIFAGVAGLVLAASFLSVPVVAAVAIPATPTNTTAVALSTSQIRFSWVENSNQTSFYVTDGTTGVTVSATTRSYTWGGIAANTNKCFWVTAKNSAGQSPWSAPACATTLGSVPATPTNTTAVAISTSQITFSWVENSNQTSFYVTDGTTGVTVSATTRSYTWGGIAANTNKCFWVTAKNASGQSPWSASACATTFGSVPATPTNTTAVAISTSQITFSWVENSNQTSFYVTDGTTGVTVSATTRSYTWGGIAANTNKCFWVTAKNASGQSPWSNPACATTLGGIPATPTNTTAVAISASQITFSWVENSNQTSFYVTDGTSGIELSASARSYTWGGLAPGTSKCFYVTAKNASGQSPWSNLGLRDHTGRRPHADPLLQSVSGPGNPERRLRSGGRGNGAGIPQSSSGRALRCAMGQRRANPDRSLGYRLRRPLRHDVSAARSCVDPLRRDLERSRLNLGAGSERSGGGDQDSRRVGQARHRAGARSGPRPWRGVR